VSLVRVLDGSVESNAGCARRPSERSNASSWRARTARSTSRMISTTTSAAGKYQYCSSSSMSELPRSGATGATLDLSLIHI